MGHNENVCGICGNVCEEGYFLKNVCKCERHKTVHISCINGLRKLFYGEGFYFCNYCGEKYAHAKILCLGPEEMKKVRDIEMKTVGLLLLGYTLFLSCMLLFAYAIGICMYWCELGEESIKMILFETEFKRDSTSIGLCIFALMYMLHESIYIQIPSQHPKNMIWRFLQGLHSALFSRTMFLAYNQSLHTLVWPERIVILTLFVSLLFYHFEPKLRKIHMAAYYQVSHLTYAEKYNSVEKDALERLALYSQLPRIMARASL
jgi:hypothetical protein